MVATIARTNTERLGLRGALMPTQESKEHRVSVFAADRVSGMRYRDIAKKHGVSVPMVRTLLRRAMMKGEVTAEEIRYEPTGRTAPVLPDGEYNAKWIARIMTRVEYSPTGCWLWKGQCGEWGYGQTVYRNRTKIIHRQFYKVINRVELERWQLVMHTCDTPSCINPSHLKIGTPSENVQDAANKGRHHNARKTHCKRGHPLDEANVNVTKEGLRQCKACARARQRINAGWTPEQAYSVPAIPFNAPTPTRVWSKGKVA
jgi:hypothetical protein